MRSALDPNLVDAVAVIGMSGRFPGARNLADFWSNLRNGEESISFFSPAELAESGDPQQIRHPEFVNAGGVLDEIEWFDASFFGFNPKEAETLDPQQRLLLECAWHALEDAGYDSERCGGLIGVYAGSALSTYLFNILSNPEHRALVGDFLAFTGNDKDFLTTRISYKLNLKGPSVAVQSACSTSLVAVAMACHSLLSHQCDMALAGGVAVRVPQRAGYVYQEGQIFSRDGHTRSFDAKASGTLFSNGLGLVVLKRLEEAIEDGDCIRAIIRGSAINNDGAIKVGYAAPSLDAQAEVVTMALANAGVEASTIGYIEAHGTATPMGDPIEVGALTKAFRAETDQKNFCAIGSVKSNLGHLDIASGVAALLKTILALEHKAIPPSINFTQPNPLIDFKNSPFYVNTELTAWKSGDTFRRAGVHSFGIGGTNAHVVLEEAAVRESPESRRNRQLLVFSARSKAALQAATANFAAHFREHADLCLADASYTCQLGRREFAHRKVLVCRDAADAARALDAIDPDRVLTGTKAPGKRSIAFLFSGREALYVNMGRDLYGAEPTFRKYVDESSEILKPRVGFDLRHLLYPAAGQTKNATQQLAHRGNADLAIFVVEYALAQLWMEWGVRPEAMIGEGVGEYVAACVAGVFSLPDALALLAERSAHAQKFPVGAVQPMQAAGLEAMIPAFTAAVEKIGPRRPLIPYVSGVTGSWITESTATNPSYWGRHLQAASRFDDGMEYIRKASDRTLLAVGPAPSSGAGAQSYPTEAQDGGIIRSLPDSAQAASEMESLLKAVGRLWLMGVPIDWKGFWRDEQRFRVPLPTYAFDRKRYWVERRPQPPQKADGDSNSNSKEPNGERAGSGTPCVSEQARCDSAGEYVAPKDDVETKIAEIWRSLLGVEQVGIYDNFFALGGHSMLGAQLLSRLRTAFDVNLPLPTLFEIPTVAGMAERVRALR